MTVKPPIRPLVTAVPYLGRAVLHASEAVQPQS